MITPKRIALHALAFVVVAGIMALGLWWVYSDNGNSGTVFNPEPPVDLVTLLVIISAVIVATSLAVVIWIEFIAPRRWKAALRKNNHDGNGMGSDH